MTQRSLTTSPAAEELIERGRRHRGESSPPLRRLVPNGHRPPDPPLDLRHLCHDLRHPATVIQALVAAVQIECRLPAAAVRRLAQIEAEAKTISEICACSLAGEPAPSKSLRLDLVAVEVVRNARLRHPDVDIIVSGPALARIDEGSVRRILWNLLDNACRACGPNGQVRVSVRNGRDEVRLEVADSGPGFGKAEPGVASLGLSVVGAMVNRHGGRVEIGEGPLGGAQITVILPLAHIDLTDREAGAR